MIDLQPGQVFDNGKITLIGRYTVAIRNAYMYYRVERYMIDHPERTRRQAGQAARAAWRNKANASMKEAPFNYPPGSVGELMLKKAMERR